MIKPTIDDLERQYEAFEKELSKYLALIEKMGARMVEMQTAILYRRVVGEECDTIKRRTKMSVAVKQATIYFDLSLHRVLRLKSAETSRSVSELVNEAVSTALQEDLADLEIFKKRANEPTISFESALKELKRNGKISRITC
jgi:hypothetical protein